MTKKEFIDFFRATLPRIDKTGKYHSNVVAHAIERAVNNVLCDLYLRFPELADPYMKEYTAVAKAQNAATGLWEATIPVSYIPIPVVGSGVREVALEDDTSLTFVPARYDDIMRTKDLTMNYLSPMVSYAVAGNKLIFSHMPSTYSADNLRLRALTSFTDYADTDEFIVPYGQDISITQNVYQILGIIAPIDLLTNNADGGRG